MDEARKIFDYSAAKEEAEIYRNQIEGMDLEIERLGKEMIQASKVHNEDRRITNAQVFSIAEEITKIRNQKRDLLNKMKVKLSEHTVGRENLLRKKSDKGVVN
jgi:hypothetical protein